MDIVLQIVNISIILMHILSIKKTWAAVKIRLNQGFHKLWKTWKVADKNPMHGKIMELGN